MIRPTTALAAAALSGAVALAGAAPAMAAPHVRDVDAELQHGGWLHLSAETSSGARRVTFHLDGRSIRGRLTDIDHEDRTRDYERTVRARGVRTGTRSIRVRVCGRGGCSTQSFRVFIEHDD